MPGNHNGRFRKEEPTKRLFPTRRLFQSHCRRNSGLSRPFRDFGDCSRAAAGRLLNSAPWHAGAYHPGDGVAVTIFGQAAIGVMGLSLEKTLEHSSLTSRSLIQWVKSPCDDRARRVRILTHRGREGRPGLPPQALPGTSRRSSAFRVSSTIEPCTGLPRRRTMTCAPTIISRTARL